MHVGEKQSDGALVPPFSRIDPLTTPPPPLPFVERLRPWLERPRLEARLVALAVAIVLPSIALGLLIDDLLHHAALLRVEPYASWLPKPWLLFTFFDGDPARTRSMIDAGLLPWWTEHHLRIAFFRPLSAATHMLDHALYPQTAWAMHVHSFAWIALLVVVAARLYRRLLGARWVAGLAALFYALDDARAIPGGWVANRNALLMATFALASVGAHHQWTKDRSRAAGIVAPLLFALGLASGEGAVAAFGFIVAHALFLEDDAARARVLRLVPYLAIIGAWIVLYRRAGCGADLSPMYVDPAAHPREFLGTLWERFPLLVLGTFAAPPPEMWLFPPRAVALLGVGLAIGFLGFLAYVFRPLLRTSRVARFFAFGTAAALLPVCGTFPSGRLTMIAGFGAFGLLAELVEHASTRAERGLAKTALIVHLVVAPLLSLLTISQMFVIRQLMAKIADSFPDDAAITDQMLISVDARDAGSAAYGRVVRALDGRRVPTSFHVLSAGTDGTTVTRVDERSLLIRPGRGYLRDEMTHLVRHPDRPMKLGTERAFRDVTAEIVELTADGRPAAVIFRFPRALEDASYRFARYGRFQLLPFAPPPPGTSVTLAPIDVF